MTCFTYPYLPKLCRKIEIKTSMIISPFSNSHLLLSLPFIPKLPFYLVFDFQRKPDKEYWYLWDPAVFTYLHIPILTHSFELWSIITWVQSPIIQNSKPKVYFTSLLQTCLLYGQESPWDKELAICFAFKNPTVLIHPKLWLFSFYMYRSIKKAEALFCSLSFFKSIFCLFKESYHQHSIAILAQEIRVRGGGILHKREHYKVEWTLTEVTTLQRNVIGPAIEKPPPMDRFLS